MIDCTSSCEWNFSRITWKVPSSAPPASPPRLCVMPNSAEKLTRCDGPFFSACVSPNSSAGPTNRAAAKPRSDWLTTKFCGRYRLVARVSRKLPTAMQASATTMGVPSFWGSMVKALTAMPATVASVTQANRPTSWSLPTPSVVSRPTTPKLCSDSSSRISVATSAKRTMSPLPSQRVLSSGLARLCSITIATDSSAMAPHSAQPSQGTSVHQRMRPWPSTAHSSAMPGANSAKVTRSSFSKTLMRSLGGSRNSATAASDSTARPSSKW